MTGIVQHGLQETSLEEIKRQVGLHQSKTNRDEKFMQLIIFKLNGAEYALPIDQVKEVVLTPSVARIPHTEKYIRGVANIRGTIITIMDLEERFKLAAGQQEAADNSYNYTLFIESENQKVGVLVKEVPNTLTVGESEIDRSSGIMQYSSLDVDCIEGIVKIGDRLIVLIDFFKMTGIPEIDI